MVNKMKKSEFKELMKKCFGKNKDDRYHAIAMLAIYGIFMFIVVMMIRVSGPIEYVDDNSSNNNEVKQEEIVKNEEDIKDFDNSSIGSNYSYTYTVTYNGNTEVYIGKKVNEKEKYTFIKDGVSTQYAIVSDSYMIFEDNTYHTTDIPNNYFKYINLDYIFTYIKDSIFTESGNNYIYKVSNKTLGLTYKDTITLDNEKDNTITMEYEGNILKTIDLDYSNYFTSINNTEETFTVHMEFTDIGTTSDFEINILK